MSAAALARAQQRLGPAAAGVSWIHADVTGAWQPPAVDIWHDRAAFHFLTEADDRRAYVTRLHQAVRPGGAVIIATFALDGPTKCSGLPVMRHDAASVGRELGSGFVLETTVGHRHRTPSGAEQPFCYSLFRRAVR